MADPCKCVHKFQPIPRPIQTVAPFSMTHSYNPTSMLMSQQPLIMFEGTLSDFKAPYLREYVTMVHAKPVIINDFWFAIVNPNTCLFAAVYAWKGEKETHTIFVANERGQVDHIFYFPNRWTGAVKSIILPCIAQVLSNARLCPCSLCDNGPQVSQGPTVSSVDAYWQMIANDCFDVDLSSVQFLVTELLQSTSLVDLTIGLTLVTGHILAKLGQESKCLKCNVNMYAYSGMDQLVEGAREKWTEMTKLMDARTLLEQCDLNSRIGTLIPTFKLHPMNGIHFLRMIYCKSPLWKISTCDYICGSV